GCARGKHQVTLAPPPPPPAQTMVFPQGWPLDHPEMYISSPFGPRARATGGPTRNHNGIDLVAPHGWPVTATADGVVSFSGEQRGYGLLVVLKHAGGIETAYGHLSKRKVGVGQQVRRGQVIGLLGKTGNATG